MNAGPVDGWHKCQSSLRSEATSRTSVTLYLDKLTLFHFVDLKGSFVLFVDSTSAISTNMSQLCDPIPKRKYANNADILSTMHNAPEVFKPFKLHHVVRSHPVDSVDFSKLMFSFQLHVQCNCMATDQLQYQNVNKGERPQPCAPCP